MSRPLLLALTVALLACAVPRLGWGQTDRAAQQRAALAVEEGRYGEALSLLNRLVEASPDDPALYLLRAQAREGRDEYRTAVADYERAVQLAPDDAGAVEGLRRARAEYERITEATVTRLRRLVAASPDNVQLRLQLAEASYEAGRFREAADAYEAYLDRTQGTPDVVRRLLIAIGGYEGDSDRGARIAERYLAFYPTDDDLYMRLGYFRLWQHDRNGATEAFEQALRLNPANTYAQDGLRRAQTPVAKASTAPSTYPIDVLTRTLAEDPTDHAKRVELIELLIGAGRYAEAQQHLDKLPADQKTTEAWKERSALVGQKLSEAQQAAPKQEFIVDRLYRELKQKPSQDEKRFRLVEALIDYERYYEAYDQLTLLAGRHDTSGRWLTRFAEVDDGLVRTLGESPLYAVDRLTYRLRHEPANEVFRLALADALLEADRFEEARAVLLDAPGGPASPEAFQERLGTVEEARRRYQAERIAALEASLQARPDDRDALVDLAALYTQEGRLEDALTLQERLLALDPSDDDARYRYAQTLRQAGYAEDALQEATLLLRRAPRRGDYQRLYVLTALPLRPGDALAEAYADTLLQSNPGDADLLVDLAGVRLAEGGLDEADRLLRRAYTHAGPAQEERIETLSLLVEREQVRQQEAGHLALINEARRLAAARQFEDALAQYDAYFEARGRRTRDELIELAGVYSAAGDYVQSLSILETLQRHGYDYEVARLVARGRYDLADYAGAIEVLERMLAQRSNDYEAWLLLGDSYRELEHYDRAREVYRQALTYAKRSRLVEDRLAALETHIRRRVAEEGGGAGLDYAGVLAPVTEVVTAKGSGTRYHRYAQGLLTQVTIPAPVMITAGVTSHFMSGTRRLVPGSETVGERVNQVYAGGYVDLTPPIASSKANYTNRLSVQAGLFDYAGGRTVPFGSLRYWRQVPTRYTASLGLRAVEGSVELWSPAGGEFGLRLTQVDMRAASSSVLPDSALRLSGVAAYSLVSDRYGTTATETGSNTGHTVQLDASYRVVSRVYLGGTFYRLGYRTTTDIYFSPSLYQSYDAWLEYEREEAPKWYFRTRAALGVVARSRGFVSKRVEADLIYRLTSHFSLVLNGSLGQSARSLSSDADPTQDRYSTFVFTGSLYWTL